MECPIVCAAYRYVLCNGKYLFIQLIFLTNKKTTKNENEKLENNCWMRKKKNMLKHHYNISHHYNVLYVQYKIIM